MQNKTTLAVGATKQIYSDMMSSSQNILLLILHFVNFLVATTFVPYLEAAVLCFAVLGDKKRILEILLLKQSRHM